MENCAHGNLKCESPVETAIEIKFDDSRADYFMHRPYVCQDCGQTVVVLHAIVEK